MGYSTALQPVIEMQRPKVESTQFNPYGFPLNSHSLCDMIGY